MNKLYVGHLEPGTNAIDLERRFKPYGDIQEVVVVPGRDFGFVTFEQQSDAQFCVDSMANSTGSLKVEFAGQPAPRSESLPRSMGETEGDGGAGGQRQPNRMACRRLWHK